MKIRLGILSIILFALAAAVVLPPGLRGDGDIAPVPQASQRSSTASRAAQLEQYVREHPADADALAALASVYLQRVRETGDSAYYALAETAAQRALAINGEHPTAIIAAGQLALGRHDFASALSYGERARVVAPDSVGTYGVLTDALVELGRYDEALVAAQQMLDRRPGFAAYSRASYLRELHGDLPGAIDAMQRAIDSAGTPQDEVWGLVLLGNLQLNAGGVDAAGFAYQRAANRLPADAMSHSGLARLAFARGDLAAAETELRAAAAARPLPEYAVALGDLLAAQGRPAEADEQYALVRAMQRVFRANGGDAGIELALFDADHDVAPEDTYGEALAAYARRPSVYGADVAAWAAYKAGHVDEARRYATSALRLGTRDPRLLYHAGIIARAAGDTSSAEAYLHEAAAMAPALSLRDAQAARDALAEATRAAFR